MPFCIVLHFQPDEMHFCLPWRFWCAHILHNSTWCKNVAPGVAGQAILLLLNRTGKLRTALIALCRFRLAAARTPARFPHLVAAEASWQPLGRSTRNV